MRISSDPQDPGFPRFANDWMVWTVLLDDKPLPSEWRVVTADEEEGLVRYWTVDLDKIFEGLDIPGKRALNLFEATGRVTLLGKPRSDPDPRAAAREEGE